MGAPLVLLEQHSAKLCECVRPRIIERPQDALTVLDGERDDASLERERLLEKRPRWSSDGRSIAFTRETSPPDIYVINAAGGAPKNLTHSRFAEFTPAWAPAKRS